MSIDARFVIYFCIGMALVILWHWIEKIACFNFQHANPQQGALSSNPQASPAAGYHHVINIHRLGLDRDILKSLPTFTYNISAMTNTETDMECPVCLSDFKDKDIYRELPVCKHRFHAECIDMWFYSHSNCPLCRANVAIPV